MKRIIMMLCIVLLLAATMYAGGNQGAQSRSAAAASIPMTIDNSELYEFTMYCDWGRLGAIGEMYMDILAKELNLKINYEFPAASGYADTITLLLASGDYPELVFMPSERSPVFRSAAEDGVFMSIERYLDSGLFPDLVQHIGSTAWRALDIFMDGRIWGIPRLSPVRFDGYGIRKDWLANVGLLNFEEGDFLTLDEMFNILYAFTHNDPNRNGVNDTYGISACNATFRSFFMEAFGVSRRGRGEGWGVFDDEVISLYYSRTNPAFKDYLTYMQRLWANGLYDPDTFNILQNEADSRFTRGVNGVFQMFPGNIPRRITSGKRFDENYDVIFTQGVVKNRGDRITSITPGTGIWFVWTLTDKAEKPERIIQLMDLALSDEHWPNLANRGVRGVNYEIDAAGNVIDLSQSIPAEWRGNNGVVAIIRFMRRLNGPEFFLDVDLTPENRRRYADLTALTFANTNHSLCLGFQPSVADSPAFIDYMLEMDAGVAQIITGQLPVSAWDRILDGWYRAGGEQYVREMRDFIASTQR